MDFFAKTEADLAVIAQYLVKLSVHQKIITFSGNLGAGKTTLIKTLCQQLGVVDIVASPTFGLVNQYAMPTGDIVYHFDCYRMKDISEAYDIGFEEYIDSGNICLIEWADIVLPLLPPSYLAVQIKLIADNARQFTIEIV